MWISLTCFRLSQLTSSLQEEEEAEQGTVQMETEDSGSRAAEVERIPGILTGALMSVPSLAMETER